MMRIALIGYGNMGREIERIALGQGHSIVARATSGSWELDAIRQADVCIEFTRPECVVDNVRRLAGLKKPIVVGTTGWQDRLEEVRAIVEEQEIGMLHASNFSIGVNLLFEILAHASRIMGAFEEYDASGVEYHHCRKKDSPSGTAREIAKTVERHAKRPLPFASIRCGSIPGTHTVLFDSPCDTISITHEARNREGFARGAIQAAQWLIGKKGLYTFADCLQERIL